MLIPVTLKFEHNTYKYINGYHYLRPFNILFSKRFHLKLKLHFQINHLSIIQIFFLSKQLYLSLISHSYI